MTTDSPRSGELAWRMDAVERRMDKAEKVVETLPILEERLKAATERLEAIQRVLWTIAGGLVLLVISVLIAAAQFGGGA